MKRMKETQKMETKKDRQRNIAYLRISNENETIKNQAFAIVQFSHEGDIRFFWDGQGNEEDPEKADDSKVQEISGAVPMRERESWPRIQSYINEFHPPKLYVFDTSRLGRDMIESLSVMEELEKKFPILSASPKESFLNSMDPLRLI